MSTTETHLVWSCTTQRLDWRTGVTLRLAMSPQSMASLSLLHLVSAHQASRPTKGSDRQNSPAPKARRQEEACSMRTFSSYRIEMESLGLP